MIEQLKDRGELGYEIEYQLLKANILKPPEDYSLD